VGASAVREGIVASSLTRGMRSTHRDSPMTWTVAAAIPVPAIHGPSLPVAMRPRRTPMGASSAALMARTRNQALMAPW
jgi:hypothetical protein